ncbi:MAG: WHG domain-containing protein [Myxococcales bacterium]|nr:WHG domain-containing protein [Myxococcales bacterium]
MPRKRSGLGKPEGAFHHGNLAVALVTRSLEVLDGEGLAALGIRRLARDLGVDPSAVYRHYRDSDALLGAVAEASFVELAGATEKAVGRTTHAEAALRAAGEAYVAYALRHPARFQAMFGVRGSGPHAWPREAGRGPSGRTAWETLEAIAEQLHEDGRLATPPPLAARAAWAAVHGVATLLIEGPLRDLGPTARRALVTATLDMTIAGLCPTPLKAQAEGKRRARASPRGRARAARSAAGTVEDGP